MLHEEGSSQTSSLCRDFTISAPLEADQAPGDLLARSGCWRFDAAALGSLCPDVDLRSRAPQLNLRIASFPIATTSWHH